MSARTSASRSRAETRKMRPDLKRGSRLIILYATVSPTPRRVATSDGESQISGIS